MAKEIVAVQAGWVFMGDVEETAYGLSITGAHVVRIWGTTKGLGELANNGPTKSTILDFAGEVRIPEVAVLARFMCKV